MSLITIIQCDGGCGLTTPEGAELPKGWVASSKGRHHECPDCHTERAATQRREQAKAQHLRELRVEWRAADAKREAQALAEWETKNPTTTAGVAASPSKEA